MVYPDLAAHWINVDRWPDAAAKNRAFEVFQAIDALDPAAAGAERDDDQDFFFLRFAPDAQEVFDTFRAALENTLRSGHDNPLMQSHLAKYRSLMPTLALLFHLVEIVDRRASPGPISPCAALAAAAWCEYLEAHARRIYQAALDGDPDTALRLAERIKASLPNPFRARDVIRKGWSGLDDVETVTRALLVLEDRGWVQGVEASGIGGGRPTTDWWINPALRSATPTEEDAP
jgi:putative DNA primase/helicase